MSSPLADWYELNPVRLAPFHTNEALEEFSGEK